VTVVIGLPCAREDDRQHEHDACDPTDGPSLGEPVVREEWLESDEGRQRPSTQVGDEDQEAVLSGFIDATLQGDGKETGKEDGRNDQEENGERAPERFSLMFDLVVLLGGGGQSNLLGFSQGGLFIENLALGGGLGLGEGLILGLLGDGLLFGMDGPLRQGMGHITEAQPGEAREDDGQEDKVHQEADAAQGLGKVQREGNRKEAAT